MVFSNIQSEALRLTLFSCSITLLFTTGSLAVEIATQLLPARAKQPCARTLYGPIQSGRKADCPLANTSVD